MAKKKSKRQKKLARIKAARKSNKNRQRFNNPFEDIYYLRTFLVLPAIALIIFGLVCFSTLTPDNRNAGLIFGVVATAVGSLLFIYGVFGDEKSVLKMANGSGAHPGIIVLIALAFPISIIARKVHQHHLASKAKAAAVENANKDPDSEH